MQTTMSAMNMSRLQQRIAGPSFTPIPLRAAPLRPIVSRSVRADAEKDIQAR
jgi:hypothetical protein